MKIQKLNWAGIKLECGTKTVLIDAVENFKPYFTVLGDPLTPIYQFTDHCTADYILFTHLHLDHFDTSVITKCLKSGGKIIAHRMHEHVVKKIGCDHLLLDTNETFTDNLISFKPMYSMDGIGDEQIAWLVEYSETKIFHGGDSIWHNQFWKQGKENKGIKYAFLPINGATVDFRLIGLDYSSVPASLTPEQAFNAAKLLRAEKLIPIHYDKFATPLYQPCDTSNDVLKYYSQCLGQDYLLLEDGNYLN